MARPKKAITKEHVLHIRLDDNDMKKIEKVCEKQGMTKASLIRYSIQAIGNKSDVAIVSKLTEEDTRILNLLMCLNNCLNKLILDTKRIGVNVNQIAKKNNSYTAMGRGLTEDIINELRLIKTRTSMLVDGLKRK